jgi:hypothetical protein
MGSAAKPVYAAADGIWAMFFAVAKRRSDRRQRLHPSRRPGGTVSEPHYFFSISRPLSPSTWRSGTVYLLPKGFVAAPMPIGDFSVLVAQLAA